MVIQSSKESLPRAPKPRGENAPLLGDTLVRQIAATWWKQYQESDKFGRDRAMPELPIRASSVSKRCDRALWYELTGTVKSNPSDAAGVFRMMLGQQVHDLVDKAMEALPGWQGVDEEGRKHGWYVEETVDLQPIGLAGSAHGDLTHYTNGVCDIVGEIKTEGGFGFKVKTTNFKGPPEGPRWAHVMQAALVAVALNAPTISVMYFALESVSPDLAASMGADEFSRFTAQWDFNTDDWRRAVEIEVNRQMRILELARANYRPERSLSEPDIPGGATVIDAEKGKWVVQSAQDGRVTNAGSTWMCGYCDWQAQCVADGADAVQLAMPTVKS